MSWRSLRVRLTATFVAIGAVIVVGAFAGAAWLLARAVWHPLDAALLEEATTLDLVRGAPDGGTRANGAAADVGSRDEDLHTLVQHLGAEHDLGPGKFVVLTGPNGVPLAAAGEVPPGLSAHGLTSGPSFLWQGRSAYRVVTHRLANGGWALLGVSADSRLRTLRRSQWALAGGALAMLLAIALLAWSITTRATREIEAVTAELEALEATALHRRLSPRTTTEVARLTQALNQLLERLELAGRRLQRFTADAAHELRTPLAALRAHLDLALARPPALETYRNGLLDAVEQTERLGVLAEDLLTLSAIESAAATDPQPVDLSLLAREVADFLDPVAQEQGRRFDVDIEPAVTALGEAPLLKRLLLNLLGNAFVHTPRGVRVSLTVRAMADAIVVEISDEGGGIAPADRQVLFERFASRRPGHTGSGLGLAICREIVLRHAGSITIESAHGTKVRVRLPCAR